MDSSRRTSRQIAGANAEDAVTAHLAGLGWSILARNVRAGRSELDIVAVDPGPPRRLVVVEVRWRRSRLFGGAEASFDAAKRAMVRRGIGRVLEIGCLPDGQALPSLPIALDLAVVEPGPGGSPAIRLYRDALE